MWVQSSGVHAGGLWTDNEQHLILRSLTSSPSTSSFHPRQLLSGPGMIWILIVFLQPPANVAVGGRKGGHNETIPSHMQRIWGRICLLQQWQEQSVLWGQFQRKKKKTPPCIQDYGVGAHWKSNGLVTSNRLGRSMLRWIHVRRRAHTHSHAEREAITTSGWAITLCPVF